MRIRSPSELCAGGIFLVSGAGFAWLSRDYSLGTLSRMGPAYFPTVLGVILALLGLLVAARAVAVDQPAVPVRLAPRPLLLVLAGTVLFGLLIVSFGLVSALAGLVLLSALAGPEFRIRDVLVLWVALSILSVAVFVYGLHLPFRVWPV